MPGWAVMANVTGAEEATALPPLSSMVTTGWGPSSAPLVEVPGCWVKTSWLAAPGLRVKVVVALVRPGEEAVMV